VTEITFGFRPPGLHAHLTLDHRDGFVRRGNHDHRLFCLAVPPRPALGKTPFQKRQAGKPVLRSGCARCSNGCHGSRFGDGRRFLKRVHKSIVGLFASFAAFDPVVDGLFRDGRDLGRGFEIVSRRHCREQRPDTLPITQRSGPTDGRSSVQVSDGVSFSVRAPRGCLQRTLNVESVFAAYGGKPFLTQMIQTRKVIPIPTELLDALRTNNHPAPALQPPGEGQCAISRPGIAADGQSAVVVVHLRFDASRGVLDFVYLEKRDGQWKLMGAGPCMGTP
jgi:hypothetical protein